MNTLASVAFGAVALTAAAIGTAAPAAARTNVGVYVNPYGIGVTLAPSYCSDYWFRQNHWNYCAQYSGYYDGYYSSGYGVPFGFRYDTRVRHGFDRHDNRGHNWGGGEHRGGHDGRHR